MIAVSLWHVGLVPYQSARGLVTALVGHYPTLCQTNYPANAGGRHYHNKSHAGLSRIQRQKSVAGIFSVVPESRAKLSVRLVMLIDDVMAAGAKLNAATACPLAVVSGPAHGAGIGPCFIKDQISFVDD